MSKNKHLSLEERYKIEHSLNDKLSFKAISKLINKDCTTISKEIRSHLIFEKKGALYRPFNDELKCFMPKTKCLIIKAFNGELLVTINEQVFHFLSL